MPRKEQDLIKPTIDLLTAFGCLCWRVNSGGMKATYKGRDRFIRFNSMPGCSDIVGVAPGGRMICVELKVGKNKPTEHQANFLAEVKKRGGIAIVAYSLDDVCEQFKEQV